VRRSAPRTAVLCLGAALLVLWTLVPFYSLVSMSLMSAGELVTRPGHLYPHDPTLAGYLRVLEPGRGAARGTTTGSRTLLVRRGWLNSLIVAVSVTTVTLAVGIPMGYALGRLKFRLRSALLVGLIATRAYPPIAVLIPLSAVFVATGLQGSLVGLGVADLTLTLPLVAWCMSGVFSSLPSTTERAARVDGLTRWQTLWRVMLPMAAPGVASCAVIAVLTTWNEFTFSMILAAGSPAQTFPPTVAGAYATEIATLSVLGLGPPAILALLFQRHVRQLNLVTPL
jgi:multiple sugar transport system permease protein